MSETAEVVQPRARRVGRPTTAKNNPVRRERHREIYTGDTPPPQLPDIDLALNRALDPGPTVVVAPGGMSKDYQDALAFNEEPVTVMIAPSAEENAPVFQECWVNGRGIEFFMNNAWRVNFPGVAPGYAPVGVEFTTRRKYAEVLIRKRVDRVRTVHEDANVENPINILRRTTMSLSPLSVVHDASPKGGEWLRRIMAS